MGQNGRSDASCTETSCGGTPLPETYSITPGSTTVPENVGTITFTITRSDSTAAETIYASTVQNQGATNNGDYVGLLNQAVIFAAGQSQQTVAVTILDDTIPENNETFGLIVQASPTDPITTFLASATFTIQDNDGTSPGITCTGTPTGTLSASPDRVADQNTQVALSWALGGYDPSVCEIDGSDSSSYPLSGASCSGTQTVSGITQQTVYTLVCNGTPVLDTNTGTMAKTVVNVTGSYNGF